MRNHLRRSIVVQVRNKTPEKVLPNHRHTSREVTRDWSDGVLRVVPELTPKTGSRNPGGLSWPTASAVSQRLLLYPIGTCLFDDQRPSSDGTLETARKRVSIRHKEFSIVFLGCKFNVLLPCLTQRAAIHYSVHCTGVARRPLPFSAGFQQCKVVQRTGRLTDQRQLTSFLTNRRLHQS